MATDYALIERQALDIVKVEVPEVTGWQRDWTNNARREIQRAENYAWMARLHPGKTPPEAVSWGYALAAGNRRIDVPKHFKELVDPRAGLFYFDHTSGERVQIPQLSFKEITERFSLTEEGAPVAHHLLRNTAVADDVFGETTIVQGGQPTTEALKPAFEVYPKPDQEYDLQIHGYFFLRDLDQTAELVGIADYILVNFDPMVIRDALCREAFIALGMWDLALRHEQARATREERATHGEKERELEQGLTLRPSFNAGPSTRNRRRLEGYDF